ncbi:unnamed protein product [Polarella glacialis]|uniref:Cytochrome P450 n=1 Tax=Polarella glacialis TaxID=89957 RepID=A0A813FFS4_POLGL|nr:unnamed protein product [Polarella glacialis]
MLLSRAWHTDELFGFAESYRPSWLSIGLGTIGALAAAVVLPQYAILRHKQRPWTDLGTPFWGHTLTMLKVGVDIWVDLFISKVERQTGRPFRSVLRYAGFQHAVIMRYDVYRDHVQKLDQAGDLVPDLPPPFVKLLGKSSILNMRASFQAGLTPQHRRIRSKVMRALAPAQVLQHRAGMQQVSRRLLEDLASASQAGSAPFEPIAKSFAMSISARLIVGEELSGEYLQEMEACFVDILAGALSPPLDLGRFSAFGRAMQARRKLLPLVKKMMAHPAVSRTALGELLLAGEEGEPLTLEEIVDTVVTLLLAGQITTNHALVQLLVDLHKHPEEVQLIRAESEKDFGSIEQDSHTLRVIKESLRLTPPINVFRRACPGRAVSLGEAGVVPAGCSMAPLLRDLDDRSWNPARWAALPLDHLLVFGGNQPHSCVGRHLALLELHIFVRELCGTYTLEVLEAEEQSMMGLKCWKDGLPVCLERL